MEINRHNYETYFLLWVDDELSAQDQIDMERFIDENPDLATELALLQEAKLPIDDSITYLNKENLLKIESPALSLSTYEEYFLLYIDNELSSKEKQEVELFVLQHPSLQASFLQLQQTVLSKEVIVFTNKELLYKKEADEKPIIYFNWRKLAIAAAVIGLIFSIWMIAPKVLIQSSSLPIAKVKNKIIPTETITASSISNGEIINKQFNSNEKLNGINQREIKRIIQHENSNTTTDLITAIPKTTIPENTQQESTNSNSIANEVNNAASIDNGAEKIKNTTASIIDEPEQPKIIKQGVYRELDTDESSSLYVGSLEINKDKLRGFFRKAGSVFRSKSKQTEDKTDTNK